LNVSGYAYGTGRDRGSEDGFGVDDLVPVVERHVTEHHVVQQTAERPDGSRLGVVAPDL